MHTIVAGNDNSVNLCYNRPLTDYQNETYLEMLAKGEWYEDYLVDLLRANGLEAGRYSQNMSELPKYSPKFSQYQRDCYIQIPGARVNVESKARHNPFQYSEVFVGKRKSWDSKRFETHFLAITCQDTLEVRVTLADRETRAKRWLSRTANDECYAVELRYFMSLEKIVRLLKMGKLPNSHWRSRQANLIETVR